MEHKELAIQLFNETWELLDKFPRTREEEILMIHKSHASLYHWLQVGTPKEFQRGEWMISHVYSILGMSESAIYHAKNCLDHTLANDLRDFDLTFAYEALARAYSLNDKESGSRYLNLAYESLVEIKDEDDRKYAKSQLDEIKSSL